MIGVRQMKIMMEGREMEHARLMKTLKKCKEESRYHHWKLPVLKHFQAMTIATIDMCN